MQQMIIVWNPRSVPLSTSIFLFPLLPPPPPQLCPSSLSSSVCPPSHLHISPFPSSWVSVTLLCSPWLEASKDGYHISLCSFRATHMHAHTRPVAGVCVCVCGVGAEWMAIATFFTFFSPGLKGLFLSQRRQTEPQAVMREECSLMYLRRTEGGRGEN